MSLVIFPPPPRRVVVFEDGDLPLQAARVDDEYAFTQFPQLARQALAQPFSDDDVLPLAAKAIDEDTPPVLAAVRAAIAAFPEFFGEDDFHQLVVSIVEDDVSAPIAIVRAAGTFALPFSADEDLPIAPADDAAAPIVSASVPAALYAQPMRTDEELPLSARAPPDESPGAAQNALKATAYAPSLNLEDDLPQQQQATQPLEDDAGIPIASFPPFVAAQPVIADEEIASAIALEFEQLGLQVQIIPPGIARQPPNSDDDMPQVVVHLVDDDLHVVALLVAVQPTIAHQPFSADEERPLPAKIVDDERFDFPSARPLQPIAFQPWQISSDELAAVVAQFYRGELLELLPLDNRLTLKNLDWRVTVLADDELRLVLKPLTEDRMNLIADDFRLVVKPRKPS